MRGGDEMSPSIPRSTPHRANLPDEGHAPMWLWKLGMGVLCAFLFYAVANAPAAEARSIASCYGPGLYGNSMANGQTLTTSTVAVAHRTLPLGTRLYVRANHRTVLVPVKDRGPFVAGRTLDLTHGAVRRLGVSDCYAWGHRPVLTWRAP
jgi:rare lipoprotein A